MLASDDMTEETLHHLSLHERKNEKLSTYFHLHKC